MTAHEPPAEAVEAACRAVHPTRWEYRTIAHPCEECATAVTAAGPIIAEKAWDEVADYLDRTNAPSIAEAARRDNPHREDQP